MFRYKEDRWPVAIILAFSLIDFILYLALDSVWLLALYFLITIVPRGAICAWNHHHQHVFTFKKHGLNRVLEFFYALHTGVTTHLWRLHHVLGHHINYLDQSKDESRWKDDHGKQMGEFRYTLEVGLTSYWRGYQVGKDHPRTQREYLTYTSLTFIAVALLLAFDPVAGLFIYLLPMLVSLFFTAWVTYDHHAGLDTENEYEASYNNMSRFFNLFTGNLGYHTAHHVRCNLHWSKLPEFHAKIEHKIPEELIINRKFNVNLRGGKTPPQAMT